MDDLDRRAREYAETCDDTFMGFAIALKSYKAGALSCDEEVAQIKSRFNELDLCQKGEAPCTYAVQLNEQLARLTAPLSDDDVEAMARALYEAKAYGVENPPEEWADAISCPFYGAMLRAEYYAGARAAYAALMARRARKDGEG